MSGNEDSDPVTTEWEKRNASLVDYFLGDPDRLNTWMIVSMLNLVVSDPVTELGDAIKRNAIADELSNMGRTV